ncbi:MAG: hypothetical protein NT062_27370 [Proteobacteria bacterium]|nr:hypothetical protein [Pseudomonadota bacterium]
MSRTLWTLMVVLASREAAAESCPLEVVLAGDRAATATIAELLRERGIAVVDAPSLAACPIVHARIEPLGESYLLAIDQHDGAPLERPADAATAATLLESYIRSDLEAPLLETRALPIDRTPTRRMHVELVERAAPPPTSRGIQLFGAAETSYATDRTSWVGVQVGGCVSLGPVCAAARLRETVVASAPASWGTVERRNTELLLGLDIPLRFLVLGGVTLTPGFAAGIGSMHTRIEGVRMGSETGGLRAEAHATLSIPLGRRLAFDVSLAGDLTQATRVETNTTMALPDEPRGLVRLGVGLRYGGL